MITKILLTLVVVIAAYLYLKRRGAQQQPESKKEDPAGQNDLPFRMIAIVFLLVSFFVTCGFFAYNWFEGRQLLEITLTTPDQSQQVYKVYKADLEERSFETIDGQIIRISAQERMQIKKLEE